MAFDTNFHNRYHQDQIFPLSVFDRGLITNTTEATLFGFKIETTHFLDGSKISRLDFFGKLIEQWIIRNTNTAFPKQPPEQLKHPIDIDIAHQNYQADKHPLKKLKWLYHLSKFKAKSALCRLFGYQYTIIMEMYGDHDLETKLYIFSKRIIFIRSKYLIKLATDLKLLKQRDTAKQKQAEIGRSINSFDLAIIDNDNINKLSELNEFNVIKHSDDTDSHIPKLLQK